MAATIALFDLGRVVLDWEPARMYSRIFDDPARRDWFLANVCTMAWHVGHDAGASWDANAAPLIAQYPEFETEIRAWGGRWMEMFHGLIPGTVELIGRLEARGVPLYALSNMPAEPWEEMLAAFPVLQRFRHVVVSGRIGMIKPDPAIYAHTLAAIGGPDAADVFFIDDSAKNIVAADVLGFRTHLFVDSAGLEAGLVTEGLL